MQGSFPTPKIALLEGSGFLHFRYLKFLVIEGLTDSQRKRYYPSQTTNSSPLKIGHPERKIHLPTIHFQVWTVSFREGIYLDSPRVSNFRLQVCLFWFFGLKFQTLGGFRYVSLYMSRFLWGVTSLWGVTKSSWFWISIRIIQVCSYRMLKFK